MNIETIIVQYFLEKDKYNLIDRKGILEFNYVDNQFFGSLEFIQMIAEMEDHFAIAFSDEHLKHPQFETVGGLINIIKSIQKEDRIESRTY
ncbi:MAG: hypothetical protein H0W64_10570 [Gammaproteobacteria bacterium]|nr:hypothetical protein [Gammaproteobacteria bacterium]